MQVKPIANFLLEIVYRSINGPVLHIVVERSVAVGAAFVEALPARNQPSKSPFVKQSEAGGNRAIRIMIFYDSVLNIDMHLKFFSTYDSFTLHSKCKLCRKA